MSWRSSRGSCESVDDSLWALRDLLSATGERLGLGQTAELGRLSAQWVEIVGPAIADHAEPTSLKEGVLRIRTPSAAWATEMSYLGREIARRANDALGRDAVEQVRVWTAPGPLTRQRRSGVERRGGDDPAPREGVGDPLTALERARESWARSRSKARGAAPAATPESRKNPW